MGMIPPLASVTDRVTASPEDPVHVVPQVNEFEPIVTAVGEPAVMVKAAGVAHEPPAMVALTTAVFAVPVLVSVTAQLEPDVQVAVPETVAVFVKLPNRPNTNPAMAMAAMSVMAMRMTVAMTGEIAFLPFTFVICILNSNLLTRLNKNCVSTISV